MNAATKSLQKVSPVMLRLGAPAEQKCPYSTPLARHFWYYVDEFWNMYEPAK